MRLWYWFLLVLFVIGIVLFLLGNYYIYVLGSGNPQSNETQFGWELMLCSIFPFAILMAIGALYFARWWKRHKQRWWGE